MWGVFFLLLPLFFSKIRETYNKFNEVGVSMTLKQQKVDVTERVIGKIKNGELELFLENSFIGKIKRSEGIQYELEHHFEVDQDQNKIYQQITTTQNPNAKYTDCDDGGWC
jgi:hypothetical protein